MKYYFSDIIPKIQRYSKKLEDETLLINHNWIVFNDTNESKVTYIFRKNGELIISEKGIGKKVKWEYLGNQQLIIEEDDVNLLFNNSFYNENILVLNLNDTDTYAFFLNETKIGKRFKSIDDINDYLGKEYAIKKTILGNPTNQEFVTYTEGVPEKLWNIFWGNYARIEITFSNGLIGEIYRGGDSGKFFFFGNSNGLINCDEKIDCINALLKCKLEQFYGRKS